jgi:RimJ/RimL family protein N-acetyltransferase
MILSTPRLLLRPFRASDAHGFAVYRSDPEVARYQTWDAPFSLEQAQEFIAESTPPEPPIPGNWYQIAIEVKGGPALAGDCAFALDIEGPGQAEVGYSLDRRYQGQGYAAEAVTRLLDYLFGELGLHRVRAVTDVENAASIRLLQRLGMRLEGHFVENVWFKGAWGSEYLYAILDNEWARSRPQPPARLTSQET